MKKALFIFILSGSFFLASLDGQIVKKDFQAVLEKLYARLLVSAADEERTED